MTNFPDDACTPVETVELSASGLEAEQVVAVARKRVPAALGSAARAAMERSAAVVSALVDSEEPVYGVSTGFGSLAAVPIPAARREELQRALIRSHAAGMGNPVETEVVRAMMLLRARTLAMGCSGARPVVADTLLALLNAGLTPAVPEYGSLGASGDLAPLAHCALALIGEGEVRDASGELRPAAAALGEAGIAPLTLIAKEGLALINGTDGMLGMLVLACEDLTALLRVADVTAAMSVEALLGTDRAFAADLVGLRPQPGQAASAENLCALLADSEIVASHRHGDPRVQDAYSLRCAAQVHGACADAIDYLRRVLDVELNAGTDNPLVLPDDDVVLSGGNFHGEPLAIALDLAGIALSELGSISERRLFRMLAGFLSELPPFLTRHSGLDSGYMLLQYTAAALATDNQLLATPASVHSLPTSADQEDHNSMGWHSAQRARQVSINVETILALEALAAAQGIDLLSPLQPAPMTGEAHAAIREKVASLDHDRTLYPEIEAAVALVRSGRLATIAARARPLTRS